MINANIWNITEEDVKFIEFMKMLKRKKKSLKKFATSGETSRGATNNTKRVI